MLLGPLDHLGADPRCVVSIVACTSDWTGGWDNTPPGGVDPFITADLKSGRMVEVIERGDVAVMMSHWTGIYWNGQELGFKVLQEVVQRLHARFDNLVWMKLSEISRYWAAKELTRVEKTQSGFRLHAPFASPLFTIRLNARATTPPKLVIDGKPVPLKEVKSARELVSHTWARSQDTLRICFDLPKGLSEVAV